MAAIELSVFDKWIPNSYISLLHVYPVDQDKVDESLHTIHATLSASLQTLCSHYPWLSGTVRSGTHIDVPPAATAAVPTIHVHPVRIAEADVAGFANGDMDAGASFDHNYVSPAPVDPSSAAAPVLYAQLTPIRDAVVLCISIHHRVADAHGFSLVINAWAALARTGVVRVLDNDREQVGRARPLVRTPPDPVPLYHRAPGLFGWEGCDMVGIRMLTLYYSGTELAALRAKASAECADAGVHLSTRDALTAHIWRCLSKAEGAGAVLAGDEKVSFGIAADVRCRAAPKIGDNYVGCCITYTVARDLSLQRLLDENNNNSSSSSGLGYAAGEVRRAVARLTPDLVDHTVGWLKAGMEEGWLGALSPGWEQGKKPVPDYSESDWSRNALYEADFGFGRPALVVPPKVFALPGLIITTCPPPALDKDGKGILLYAHLTAKQYLHLGPGGDMTGILHSF